MSFVDKNHLFRLILLIKYNSCIIQQIFFSIVRILQILPFHGNFYNLMKVSQNVQYINYTRNSY